MSDVFIVGAGIHPFGRTPHRTGLQQGAFAVRQALAAAGLAWTDMQFAFGGSDAAGNADTMVSDLGLTGIQFINVANGCATGGSAMFGAYATIKSGEFVDQLKAYTPPIIPPEPKKEPEPEKKEPEKKEPEKNP